MALADIEGSKMRTLGPKSGAGSPGVAGPPHAGEGVQLGGQSSGMPASAWPPVPVAPPPGPVALPVPGAEPPAPGPALVEEGEPPSGAGEAVGEPHPLARDAVDAVAITRARMAAGASAAP